jgi:hypothetical protein
LSTPFRAHANQIGKYPLAHVDERDIQPEDERAVNGHLRPEGNGKIDSLIQWRYRKIVIPRIKATSQGKPKYSIRKLLEAAPRRKGNTAQFTQEFLACQPICKIFEGGATISQLPAAHVVVDGRTKEV